MDPKLLPGMRIVGLDRHIDHRGWFEELSSPEIKARVPECRDVIQINLAYSVQGVLRGLHLQDPPQGKLITCLGGQIYDVALDPETGAWAAVVLSAELPRALWIPPGYAHGYQVMSDFALVHYVVDAPRNPETERSLIWDDYGIAWPLVPTRISKKDSGAR